jgi:predicted  nucleic acid-binding Zn-ribbon protein
MAIEKRGFASNPQAINKAGAPTVENRLVPSSAELQKNFKAFSIESLNNIVDYMRTSKEMVQKLSDEIPAHEEELSATRETLITLKMDYLEDKDNPEYLREVKILENRIDDLRDIILATRKMILACADTNFKASVKILDTSFNITVHEDKMKLEKRKLRASGNKVKPLLPNGEEDDSEDEDEDDSVVVSTTAIRG